MPGQLLSKRMGPDRFIPCQMFAWGVVTACQFFIKGRTSFFVLRALLGLTQGSFIPDIRTYAESMRLTDTSRQRSLIPFFFFSARFATMQCSC